MKTNLPVTNEETYLHPTSSLVSKTDLKGTITYVNDAFCEVSGFDREELIGQSHNIVRHPDMPPAVFAHMWRTLKRGHPWRGTVKNRCKDGSYYWVDASVVPVLKDDQTIGYMSVRQYVTPEISRQAEEDYARLRKSGAAIPDRTWFRALSIRKGFVAGSLFVAFLLVVGGVLGIGGLRMSSTALENVTQQQVEPLYTANQINALILENRAAVFETPGSADVPSDDVQKRRQEIEALWETLEAAPLSSEARLAVSAFRASYVRYVEEGMRPLRLALVSGIDAQRIQQMVFTQVAPLYREMANRYLTLQSALGTSGGKIYEDTLRRNRVIERTAIAGILFGMVVVLVAGSASISGVVNPLRRAIARFDRIAQGDLSADIHLSGSGETGHLNRAVATMQLHLKVMLDEITLVTHRIYDSCQRLNEALQDVAEHSEEQHDRVYQANSAMRDTADQSMQLGEQVAGVAQAAETLLAALSSSEGSESATLQQVQQVYELSQQAAVSTQLQAFGAEEIALKMNQIADLIVENRHQAQSAYVAAAELKMSADQLVRLVSYFNTARRAFKVQVPSTGHD